MAAWALKRYVRRVDTETCRIRAEHFSKLQKAEQNNLIVVNDLLIDSNALQLACHEMADATDATTGGAFFDGDWQAIRDMLRKQARDFVRVTADDRLKQIYKVPILGETTEGIAASGN